MVVNYFCHLTFLAIPYLILLSEVGQPAISGLPIEKTSAEDHSARFWLAAILVGWWILYTLIFEQLMCCILLKRSNFSSEACGYLQIKIITGALRRSS
jgi:hypothetical protein